MGNASGKEEGENGGGNDPSGSSATDSGLRDDFPQSLDPRSGAMSLESIANTPLEMPDSAPRPPLFAAQVPVAPLQRVTDVPPIFNQMWMGNAQEPMNLPSERGIPTIITWNYGGKQVLVEGSWDNWTSRKTMQRSGKDYSILLVLPSGVYQYRFIVDGEWRYSPDLPCTANEMGHVMNLLDVNDYVPENPKSIAEFEPPLSPDSSYSQLFPVDEDFAKEPPSVPPQLHLTVLGMRASTADTPTKPQHVVLNHLFIEKGWASQSLIALGLTHRFQSKYVTVVLYKPLRRSQ